MKTKEQIQKLIEEKQKELDQLKQELQTAKSLKEAWREEYEKDDKDSKYYEARYLSHYTKESFEFWMEQFNLMTELQIFAKLRNGDWVADWGRESKTKYGITMDSCKSRVDCLIGINLFVYGIAFKSEEIAQEALEIFGQRIEQFYGK